MRILLCLILLSLSHVNIAGEANVLAAEVEYVGGEFYRFKVTVEHSDENWTHFAKAWEVLTPDGKLLGARILRHPHINEQPFSRTTTITIPNNINRVIIRAYDLIHEYGGRELILDINKEIKNESD